jgi:hypothetical protein
MRKWAYHIWGGDRTYVCRRAVRDNERIASAGGRWRHASGGRIASPAFARVGRVRS